MGHHRSSRIQSPHLSAEGPHAQLFSCGHLVDDEDEDIIRHVEGVLRPSCNPPEHLFYILLPEIIYMSQHGQIRGVM